MSPYLAKKNSTPQKSFQSVWSFSVQFHLSFISRNHRLEEIKRNKFFFKDFTSEISFGLILHYYIILDTWKILLMQGFNICIFLMSVELHLKKKTINVGKLQNYTVTCKFFLLVIFALSYVYFEEFNTHCLIIQIFEINSAIVWFSKCFLVINTRSRSLFEGVEILRLEDLKPGVFLVDIVVLFKSWVG